MKLFLPVVRGVFVATVFVAAMHFFTPAAELMLVIIISLVFPVGFLLSELFKRRR